MPNLRVRAYRAAWLHNAIAATYLNLTNPVNGSQLAFSYMTSEVGSRYRISNPSGSDQQGIAGVDGLSISQSFGSYLKPARDSDHPGTITNPWDITDKNWTASNYACSDTDPSIYANISNILVACGLMRGVPQRLDGGSSNTYERDSQWSQKIFTCASAVKATVKTVTFEYTGSGSLEGLKAIEIKDKEYSDEADMPLWGVENSDGAYLTGDIQLIWGIVDDTYIGHPNVSTLRRPSLYLPGNLGLSDTLGASYGSWQNFPGADFPFGALSASYKTQNADFSSQQALNPTTAGADYTGHDSLAMWARWQNLTAHADLASLIPNLLYTDIAASRVVGTKSTLGSRGNHGARVPVTVQPIISTVRYHMAFGIPAFIVAAILVALGLWLIVCTIFPGPGKRRGFERMRLHIQGLASGRIYTMKEYPAIVDGTTNAKSWNSSFGTTNVSLVVKEKEENQLLSHDEDVVVPKTR